MTDPMTPDREQDIRARAEAATPGPWGTSRDLEGTYTIKHGTRVTLQAGFDSDGDVAVLTGDDQTAYRNGAFTAHARQDIPALLAEIDRLRADRDAAVAAAVRRALNDAKQCPSQGRIDGSKCVLPIGHGSHHRNKQGNYHWDDSHAAVASPDREQGPALPLLHQACSCGHFRNWHWNGTETVGCRDCECTEFRYAREHGHSCRNREGVDPDNCLMNPAREPAPEATR